MQMYYETERLCLRILQPNYAADVLQFYKENKELFEKFEPTRPMGFYTTKYQSTLLNHEFNLAVKLSSIRFWVFLKDSEQIIGTISFHNINRTFFQNCQIGYKFDPCFWNQGYAKESIRKGISIIFDEIGLRRIEAMVLPSNTPSIRLLESLGFMTEGICRSYIYLSAGWADHLRFSLIHP